MLRGTETDRDVKVRKPRFAKKRQPLTKRQANFQLLEADHDAMDLLVTQIRGRSQNQKWSKSKIIRRLIRKAYNNPLLVLSDEYLTRDDIEEFNEERGE